jgi:hypothetical protein
MAGAAGVEAAATNAVDMTSKPWPMDSASDRRFEATAAARTESAARATSCSKLMNLVTVASDTVTPGSDFQWSRKANSLEPMASKQNGASWVMGPDGTVASAGADGAGKGAEVDEDAPERARFVEGREGA